MGVFNNAFPSGVTLPAVGDVEQGVQYGLNGTEFSGTFAVPAAEDVEQGVQYGAGGTEFTGTLVAAAADYPDVGDVRLGTQYDSGNLTGTLVLPNQQAVRTGASYGTDGTELSGQVVIPAVADVRAGTAVDAPFFGLVGTLEVPSESEVLAGVSFDVSSTGNVVLPGASHVRSGQTFGPSSGTTGTATIPAAADVEWGVAVDAGVGTFVVPTEAQVQDGVNFGNASEFTGTLTGGVSTGSAILVDDDNNFSVIRGDDYAAADGRAIQWTGTTADQWPDLTGATLVFGAMGLTATFDVSVVQPTGSQAFRMQLTKEETVMESGRYPYDVQATLASGNVVTLARGTMSVEQTYTDVP